MITEGQRMLGKSFQKTLSNVGTNSMKTAFIFLFKAHKNNKSVKWKGNIEIEDLN